MGIKIITEYKKRFLKKKKEEILLILCDNCNTLIISHPYDSKKVNHVKDADIIICSPCNSLIERNVNKLINKTTDRLLELGKRGFE